MTANHSTPISSRFALATMATALTLLAGSASGTAATITLRPDASSSAVTNGDAFVTTGPSGNLASNNYGGAGALAISASGLAKGGFASLLRFDAAAAKTAFDTAYGQGGWVLDTAVLQLTTANANNAIFNTSAAGAFSVRWMAADGWTEGTGTPAAASATGINWSGTAGLLPGSEAAGTFALASVADGITANYSLTLTPGLAADLGTGGSLGFYLEAADSTVSAVFNSRSFATASRNPALILTTSPVPEPGALALLLPLAAGCLVRRRRTAMIC